MYEVIRILGQRKAFCSETSGCVLLWEGDDLLVIDSNFIIFFLRLPASYAVCRRALASAEREPLFRFLFCSNFSDLSPRVGLKLFLAVSVMGVTGCCDDPEKGSSSSLLPCSVEKSDSLWSSIRRSVCRCSIWGSSSSLLPFSGSVKKSGSVVFVQAIPSCKLSRAVALLQM